MKKFEYLSKYNYIDYYIKLKGLWFFSINEIEEKLEWEINLYLLKKKNKNFNINDENSYDELEDSDELEIDSYELYK